MTPRSALVALLFCAVPLTAAEAGAEPDPSGKGIAGGVLLGGEIAVFGEAIAGIETPWLYWLGAGLGAVGGGIGGYYVESGGAPRSSYYLLAGGMALSIPATIVYLDATDEARRYAPPVETGPNYDEEPFDEPEQALGGSGARARAVPEPLDGTLRYEGEWELGPPRIYALDVGFSAESWEFSVPRRTRVFVSLLSGAF